MVVCITGNGYKTAEIMRDRVAAPTQIGRSLADFDRVDWIPREGSGVSVSVMFPAFLNLEVAARGAGGRRTRRREQARVAAGGWRAGHGGGAGDSALKSSAKASRFVRRAFEEHDLDGAWWVVAAAPPDVNRRCRRPPRRAVCS